MNEPTYEYVKGEGWVICTEARYSKTFTYHDGKQYTITILLRPPVIGECGWRIRHYQHFPDMYERILSDISARKWSMNPDGDVTFGWMFTDLYKREVESSPNEYVTVVTVTHDT